MEAPNSVHIYNCNDGPSLTILLAGNSRGTFRNTNQTELLTVIDGGALLKRASGRNCLSPL